VGGNDAATPGVAVRIGNALFHWRNGLFPLGFIAIALASRPLYPFGSARADAALDAAGFAIALAGQALRAVVIGLAYIRRGGKDRRIHADALVTDGFFAHSRNPLYVGNMMVYLGLFLILNSALGYAVGVPFFLAAYVSITLAEEDFLRRRFGADYEAYVRRVPRYLPDLRGIGATVRGMRFDWRRLIRKEYGSTFSWMTTALALVWWESVRNRGAAASGGVLAGVLGAWAVLVASYLVARILKKTGRLHGA
jgi:protein-S-isoprenylcysteine O-methyltransferase Ste14